MALTTILLLCCGAAVQGVQLQATGADSPMEEYHLNCGEYPGVCKEPFNCQKPMTDEEKEKFMWQVATPEGKPNMRSWCLAGGSTYWSSTVQECLVNKDLKEAAKVQFDIQKARGADEEDASYSVVKELVHEEMKSFFRPEFLNRLDETVVFRPLAKDDICSIAEVEFAKVVKRLQEVGLDVSLTTRFKEHVVNEGYDPAYGARPLRRAITRLLEDKLAEHLLLGASEEQEANEEGNATERARVLVDMGDNGNIQVHELSKAVNKSVLA